VGSREFLRGPLCAELRAAGVEVAAALPVSLLRAAAARVDLRNHRKLAVLDGRVAYTGSHNVSMPIYPRKARYGAWVDATVRLEGPSVHDLQEVFLEDWHFATEKLPADDRLMPLIEGVPPANVPIQVLPTGPENRESPLADVLLQALRAARERVVLTTPYFVPDEAFVATLRSAAMRGVQVSIVVPKHSDHALAQAAGRSQYGYLLEAGVKVFEHTAGLLHSKTLTVDGQMAVIGSANLDVRSFLLNFELCVLVYDPDFASQLHFLQASYVDASEALTIGAWKARGRGRVLWDNTAKLMGPLL
jgi:cardiolipin synthase